ncbi:hypothetical protein ILYODFUR_013805 [Ilyodon furcidens]|uniref:Uncharacterized protein n=1 Tax=Ilyodon furcidens TaxID=33524 RepID=A0ABV0T7V0_9TELE
MCNHHYNDAPSIFAFTKDTGPAFLFSYDSFLEGAICCLLLPTSCSLSIDDKLDSVSLYLNLSNYKAIERVFASNHMCLVFHLIDFTVCSELVSLDVFLS